MSRFCIKKLDLNVHVTKGGMEGKKGGGRGEKRGRGRGGGGEGEGEGGEEGEGGKEGEGEKRGRGRRGGGGEEGEGEKRERGRRGGGGEEGEGEKRGRGMKGEGEKRERGRRGGGGEEGEGEKRGRGMKGDAPQDLIMLVISLVPRPICCVYYAINITSYWSVAGYAAFIIQNSSSMQVNLVYIYIIYIWESLREKGPSVYYKEV